VLRKLFWGTFNSFSKRGYFDESIGFYCVDLDFVSGYIGEDFELYLLRKLRKDNLYPIEECYIRYTSEDIFDLIELLYDIVSKPMDGEYHSWNDCGMHYNTFNRHVGQKEFMKEVNEFLVDFEDGWELSKNGEILLIGDEGLREIFMADIPNVDENNITGKINRAIHKYRQRGTTTQMRREAVRELADVLEYLKSDIKKEFFKKDESDLFQIANRFGIRHNDPKQLKDYDSNLWLSWIFYVYLSSIHLMLRLINREQF